jgi:phage tail-like protein
MSTTGADWRDASRSRQRRLFSTRSARFAADTNGGARSDLARDPPEVASARALYRSRLPDIYQEGDFGLRFVGGLERVLDPLLALLDSLPSHFDADLAPPDCVELLAAWLGVELDESWPLSRRREIVRRAPELARRRGTAAGLELALSIAFPDLPLRVEDGGGVTWSLGGDAVPAAKPPAFVVYCDKPVEPADLALVARMIEHIKPVYVSYKLRVKTRRAEG